MPSFIPPNAGTLPAEGRRILKEVYSACRAKNDDAHQTKAEIQTNKRICSAVAWNAVDKVFKKGKLGQWTKIRSITHD